MTIRAKVLIIVAISLLCTTGLMYATSRFTFLRGINEIEEQSVARETEQTIGALNYLIADLEADTADWAAWDDSYEFVRNRDEDYIRSNLVDETFIKLKLNIMLYADTDGEIVYQKVYDFTNESEVENGDIIVEQLQDRCLGASVEGLNYVSGIVLLDDGPMLVALQPILTSEDQGPTRGTLIFGRFLDETTLEEVSKVTLLSIEYRAVNMALGSEYSLAYQALQDGGDVYVSYVDAQHIAGFSLFSDIFGQPALVFRVELPREAYRLGQLAVGYYIIAIIGVGILVSGFALLILKKQILERFSDLIKGIDHIANTGDTSTRVEVGGRDELSLVAGTINGMLATIEEAGTEIEERERRYRLLAENVTDVICTLDSELRFTYISPSITQLAGYSVDEAVNLTLEQLLDEESYRNIFGIFNLERNQAEGNTSSPRSHEMCFIKKNGEPVWVEISISGIRETDKRVVGFAAVVRNISERKEAEKILQQLYEHERDLRQKLEEEIQKRIEYTRALVHELKTPITPVLAATDLLMEEVNEDRLKRLVQNIDRSANNLNQRIDELLDLARGEVDMLHLDLSSVDPLAVLSELGSEMIPVAEAAQQHLRVQLPEDLPMITADRERLRQIVVNLLNNAVKFTPAGGTITLKAGEVDGNLVVEVEDTGLGISLEDQERLFEPYYRKIGDRDRLSGLGLGLALAKGFVELHGGRIWVKSDSGQGSIFGFSIPITGSELNNKEPRDGEGK